MSYTTLIRFAPLTTLERLNDPLWARPGRTLYDHNSLTFFPNRTSVPLLINHDATREIGVVRELTRFEDTDGPWLVALATVTNRPQWLRPGTTRASFGYRGGRTSSFDGDVLRQGQVTEVSVLSHEHEPLEPGARVLTLREDANPILPVAPAGATVIAGGQILRRPVGQVLGVR